MTVSLRVEYIPSSTAGIDLQRGRAADIDPDDVDIDCQSHVRSEDTALDDGAARHRQRDETTQVYRSVEPELQPRSADLEMEVGADDERADERQLAVQRDHEIGAGWIGGAVQPRRAIADRERQRVVGVSGKPWIQRARSLDQPAQFRGVVV